LIDIDRIIDRFQNLRETQRLLQIENISAYFTEREIKEMIYLLGELKVLKGDDLK
jgi:hypothetical protein